MRVFIEDLKEERKKRNKRVDEQEKMIKNLKALCRERQDASLYHLYPLFSSMFPQCFLKIVETLIVETSF